MVSGVNASPSANAYLASILGSKTIDPSAALRAADNSVRAQATKLQAQGGPGALVTTKFSYEIGPDGELYATSATVSTSKRTLGAQQTALPQSEQTSLYESAFSFLRNAPKSLSDFLRSKLSMAPADEAAIYGSDAFRNDALNNEQAQRRARLQLADFGVRAQESQHFRAANGLGDAPVYEYEVGPDGELYAVAGSVGIRSGTAATPEEAAQNAATVARAALAATDVSAQDVSVARRAQSEAAALYSRNFYATDAEDHAFSIIG